jgi:hypothetical protein
VVDLAVQAQSAGSSYYASANTIITFVIMLNLIGTILYFVTVLVVEIVVMCTEASRAREMLAAQKTGKHRRKSALAAASASDVDTSPVKSQSSSAAITGPTDSSINPMFLSQADGSAANPLLAGGQAARDAVLALTTPPPQELWSVFQGQFVTLTHQVRKLWRG